MKMGRVMGDEGVLRRCSDVELSWLLMRELYRIYDHGGHSGRSVRAMVLEAGMAVGFRSLGDLGVPSCVDRDALAYEVARRGYAALQLTLFDELSFLTTEDYLRCVVMTVRSLHNMLPEPSTTEAFWIELLARLLQTERTRILAYDVHALIRESRNRTYREFVLR